MASTRRARPPTPSASSGRPARTRRNGDGPPAPLPGGTPARATAPGGDHWRRWRRDAAVEGLNYEPVRIDVGGLCWTYLNAVEDDDPPETQRRHRLLREAAVPLASIELGDDWAEEYRLVLSTMVERYRAIGEHTRRTVDLEQQIAELHPDDQAEIARLIDDIGPRRV